MSVILWDGRDKLVTDRQVTFGGKPYQSSKIRRWGDYAIAFVGEPDAGEEFVDWIISGQKAKDFPESLRLNPVDVYVFQKHGVIKCFAKTPLPICISAQPLSAGSGGNYAMGAFLAGASPERAVEIAIDCDNACGCGIEMVRLDTAL